MSKTAPSTAGRVLGLLLAAGRVSGQEMGRRLDLSRAAVGKAVAALRAAGFAIDARSGAGYRLLAEPDLLLPARLEARLALGGPGLPYRHFLETDSTNLQARAWAEAGAPHGALVAAEFQSAGRGRLDHDWQAPAASGILFSIILRPALAVAEVFGFTTLASLAICRAVEKLSDLSPAIKWPNDVFLGGKKLVGVLTEFTCRAERVEHVVVGAGINCNLSAPDLARFAKPAASLSAASGRAWDRAELLAEVMSQFGALEKVFLAGDRQSLAREYQSRSLLAGRQIKVRDGDKVLTGRAGGIDPLGALLLLGDDGTTHTIVQGDVSLLEY